MMKSRNTMRMAAVMLCGAAMALPMLAQSGQTNDGPPPAGQQGPPPPGGTRGGGPARRLEMMQKELNLTPDQTAKVKTILEDGRTQMAAARNDASGGGDRSKMMDIMRSENEKIKAVLDDTQKVKFEEMEKRMRERRRGGEQGPPPSAPPPQ